MTEKPPTTKKRPRKAVASTDKRERILRAAIRVFARKGFYATRVSEIAKAAGVADGTIYLYFKNKDDVLVSIFEDGIGRLLLALREETAGELSASERIERAIELQLGLLEGRRDLAEVITVNLRQSSKLMKQYGAPLFNEYIDFLASIVADGQRAGELRQDVSPPHRRAWPLGCPRRRRHDVGPRRRRSAHPAPRREGTRDDPSRRPAPRGHAADVDLRIEAPSPRLTVNVETPRSHSQIQCRSGFSASARRKNEDPRSHQARR